MEIWWKLSIWVAVYGFLKDCQPLDSYITQYLVNSPLNFTNTEVVQVIYPVATYVSLVELIFVFLLTDWLRYRPVIFVNAVSYIGMMVVLIWFRGIHAMCIMEICFGTVLSTEVAYYTYIYTKVGREHYQAVTSYMRTSSLLGRCVGCFVGQLFRMNGAPLLALCYIQLLGAVTTFLWAFILPPVETSLYFYRYDRAILDKPKEKPVVISNGDIIHNVENGYSPAMQKVSRVACNLVFKKLWIEFKYVYTNPYTLTWSIWYAICLCGYNQEGTYAQTLWQDLQKNQSSLQLAHTNGTVWQNEAENLLLYDPLKYTGFTEVAHTIFGAIGAFASSYVIISGEIGMGFLMSLSVLVKGTLVLWAARTPSLWEAYYCHVLFSGIYFFAVSIGYAEIAKNIPSDCFALVFGINTFISLVMQSFITAIFNGKGGLELNPRQQFVVLAVYFFLFGCAFLFKCIYSLLQLCKSTCLKSTSTVSK